MNPEMVESTPHPTSELCSCPVSRMTARRVVTLTRHNKLMHGKEAHDVSTFPRDSDTVYTDTHVVSVVPCSNAFSQGKRVLKTGEVAWCQPLGLRLLIRILGNKISISKNLVLVRRSQLNVISKEIIMSRTARESRTATNSGRISKDFRVRVVWRCLPLFLRPSIITTLKITRIMHFWTTNARILGNIDLSRKMVGISF